MVDNIQLIFFVCMIMNWAELNSLMFLNSVVWGTHFGLKKFTRAPELEEKDINKNGARMHVHTYTHESMFCKTTKDDNSINHSVHIIMMLIYWAQMYIP